jgi:ABC-type multidrug transport system fused ATPase/permease subunit
MWVLSAFSTQLALKSRPVGAMIYVSPTLTMLMLAVVPPVSLGAVCFDPHILYLVQINSLHWQVFYGLYLKKLSNQTQEAIGDMTKVRKNLDVLIYLRDFLQVASEALSALRTVQSFNAVPQEEQKFHDKVVRVLTLARREAIASGIFFGSTSWSGNVTLLGLLGYGWSSESDPVKNIPRVS